MCNRMIPLLRDRVYVMSIRPLEGGVTHTQKPFPLTNQIIENVFISKIT